MALSRREVSDPRQVALTVGALVALAAAAGAAAGYLLIWQGAAPAAALLIGIPVGLVGIRSIWLLVGGFVAVMTLLPFGVVPVSAGGASPTLFELGFLAAGVAYLAILLLDRRERLHVGLVEALWLVFAGYLVFAFVLGAGRGASQQLMRDFFKFGLAVLVFPLVVQLVRRTSDVRLMQGLVVGGTALSSFIALALYAGGPELTNRVLVRLIPYGYPSSQIVRFIEDDPARAMRAIGTGVDPNAFGGMAMVGFVLAVGMLASRSRAVPWGYLAVAAGLLGLATLLTYSRGAWVGAAAGVAIILWFRARVLLIPMGLFGVAALALGLGSGFVQRLIEGLQFEDRATQLRLEEYRNALEIIRRHPWFGIGFGDAPAFDLGVGVSSIYLTVAEVAGLVGLALYLLLIGVIVWKAARAFLRTDDDRLLTSGAAFASILTVGLVDHYFFNIQFAHMVALFWLLAGLLVAQVHMLDRGISREETDDGTATRGSVRAGGDALR